MSTESAFEAFCATHAQRQQTKGVEVPPRQSHSFAYYQWLETAKQQFNESRQRNREDGGPVSTKKIKTEQDTAQIGVARLEAGNALAAALAQRLVASLEAQSSPSSAPASLRHAAGEAFPMPPAVADMPAFLTLAEAAVRLTLWHPGDARLAQLAARLRPNLRSLEEKGMIRTRAGCFPGLQLLMDLLSWRIIAHRWSRLTREMRQVAVEGVQTLCSCVRGPATQELRAAVQRLDVASAATTVPIAQLDNLVGQVSATIPFQFDACRDLATLYPEPTGVLCVPPEPATPSMNALPVAAEPTTSIEHVKSSTDSDSEADAVRVGDLIGPEATTSSTTAAVVVTEEPTKEANGPPYEAHPVLDVVPRASGGRAAATNSAGTRRMPAGTVNGHPACVSPYHARYADASKHASAECQYCATCHLMEVIFRGETRDCTWKHWPTTRKIQFHLKRFPNVLKLALRRFSEMERGVQLAVTDEVPL